MLKGVAEPANLFDPLGPAPDDVRVEKEPSLFGILSQIDVAVIQGRRSNSWRMSAPTSAAMVGPANVRTAQASGSNDSVSLPLSPDQPSRSVRKLDLPLTQHIRIRGSSRPDGRGDVFVLDVGVDADGGRLRWAPR
jgi:hypothetical protein